MGWKRRQPKQTTEAVPNHPGTAAPLETLYQYWHPQRLGVEQAPETFRKQLRAVDPDLAAVKSPFHQRWLIWCKNERIQHPMCLGWQLLFVWEHAATRIPMPLNELVFHNLFMASQQRWGNAVTYFDRVQAEMNRARAARQKAYQDHRRAVQQSIQDGWKISSAGRGNRSALHHDGTMVPSPAHAAWMAETEKQRLPSELLRAKKDDKEREVYGR